MPTATIDSAPSSGYRTEPDWATLHDIDDQRHLAVIDYPIRIDIDSFDTDLGPGCFQESWAKQLPVMCVNHDQTSLLGRAVAAESFPDSHRVIGKFSNFDDVPQARSAFANIRDGVFPGWSFHFVDGRSVPHPNGNRSARRYHKARMIEFGPVLAPSIEGTRVVGLRSLPLPHDSWAEAALADKLDEAQARSLGRAIEDAQHRSLQVCAAAWLVPHRMVATLHDVVDRAELAYHEELDSIEDGLARRFGRGSSGYRSELPPDNQEPRDPRRGANRCPTCQGLCHIVNGQPSVTGPLCPTCGGTGWVR